MYYCGALREATPPALIEELLNETDGDEVEPSEGV